MKLQQLRYIWEVAQNDLNISTTADALFTSQPGISKQIKQLEDELGIPVFTRHGKHLTEITPGGRKIVELAGDILGKVEDIRSVAQEHRDYRIGALSIATTHTQARYALPPVVREFMRLYPDIKLHIHQGTPSQIAELASRGLADIAIATEAMELYENLVLLPCYRWNRTVLVPAGHPLTEQDSLTLQALAEYPLVTYLFGFTGRSKLDRAFEREGLRPQIVLTAVDADVIKTYVRLGLGVGIIAHMAYDPVVDGDLVALDASHLFEYSITNIGLRRDVFMRRFLYDFIGLFAPHLTREVIDQALRLGHTEALSTLFTAVELPVH